MAKSTTSKGIFRETDEIISDFLGLRHGETLKQKKTCRRLSSTPKAPANFEQLVFDLYKQIKDNRVERTPSVKNWQPRRQIYLNPENKSPEVLLERAIAILGTRDILEGWYNQIPVASGLVDGWADKRAALDLLHLEGGRAEFVELKWKSDSPVFAAFEILRYGLAYLFCYANQENFGYEDSPLMNVKEVSLRVLAPRVYYADSDQTWLCRGLNEAIRALATAETKNKVSMDFDFRAFPTNFALPFKTGEDVLEMRHLPSNAERCWSIVSAIGNMGPIWPDPGNAAP